jgi:molybdenum cofactor cytidylyltransferase
MKAIPRPGGERVEGVILAAGSSSRAGGFKPGLPIDGRPMIERSIAGMSGICSRIIVVGGHEFERLRSLVEHIENVECVQNVAHEKGMFTSVKVGLSRVRGERCFVLPGDIPLVPRRVYEGLLSVDSDVVVPSFRGKTGHPVCCSASVIARILQEPDESSLRDVLRIIGFYTMPFDAEEILVDIDTPGDHARVQERFQ